MNFTFRTPPEIVFDYGASARLGDLVAERFRRPIFVTDRGLVDAGLVEPALKSLSAKNIDAFLFDDVVADPPAEKVNQALLAGRRHGLTALLPLAADRQWIRPKLSPHCCTQASPWKTFMGPTR